MNVIFKAKQDLDAAIATRDKNIADREERKRDIITLHNKNLHKLKTMRLAAEDEKMSGENTIRQAYATAVNECNKNIAIYQQKLQIEAAKLVNAKNTYQHALEEQAKQYAYFVQQVEDAETNHKVHLAALENIGSEDEKHIAECRVVYDNLLAETFDRGTPAKRALAAIETAEGEDLERAFEEIRQMKRSAAATPAKSLKFIPITPQQLRHVDESTNILEETVMDAENNLRAVTATAATIAMEIREQKKGLQSGAAPTEEWTSEDEVSKADESKRERNGIGRRMPTRASKRRRIEEEEESTGTASMPPSGAVSEAGDTSFSKDDE